MYAAEAWLERTNGSGKAEALFAEDGASVPPPGRTEVDEACAEDDSRSEAAEKRP